MKKNKALIVSVAIITLFAASSMLRSDEGYKKYFGWWPLVRKKDL